MLSWLLLASSAYSGTYTHQGRLLDVSGTPIDGDRTFIVRVHEQATGGQVLWEKTFAGRPVQDGYYTLELTGLDNTTNDLDVALTGDRWISVDVGDGPMARVPVRDVPHAGEADSVPLVDTSVACDEPGAMGFDASKGVGAICDGSAWRLLAGSPATGGERRLLVADFMRENSSISSSSASWVYTSLDGKAGPYTITTRGGPVRVYFKSMSYTYGHSGNNAGDYASVIVHPVVNGVRQDYCDYMHINGHGGHADMHAPLVCDTVYALPAGTHTIGFEHRSRGYQSILYGPASRSTILIEELPAAELVNGPFPAPAQ